MGYLLTNKPVLTYLGFGKLADEVPVREPGELDLGDWAIGAKTGGGEGLLIGFHCVTKWAFLIGMVSKRARPDIEALFGGRLAASLEEFGLMPWEVQRVLDDIGRVELARTRDLSLIGEINAAAEFALAAVLSYGDAQEEFDHVECTVEINSRVVKSLGARAPQGAMRDWLSAEYGVRI